MRKLNLIAAFLSFSLINLASAESENELNENLTVETVKEESADYFARDSLRLEPVICPFKGEIKYEPGEIECSLLEVPENREKPDSRFIELHVVKLNAIAGTEREKALPENSKDESWTKPAAGKREDAVVYLTGGPGAKVTTYVKRFKDHRLIRHRDLYILEQRGIGSSDDFCPFYSSRLPSLSSSKDFNEQLANGNLQAKNCAINATRSGVDLTGYNTIENARDVQALRMALGFKQWNVWGISYGSILGQAYVRQDPEGIKAVALDAIMPLFARDEALFWRVAKWYDRDLKKLEKACKEHESCGENFPDFIAKLKAAASKIKDSPITVKVKDIEQFPDGKATLYQDIAAMLPFMLFYEQSNYAMLPALIDVWSDSLEQRNETLFKVLSQMSGNFFSSSQGMRDAILCLDGGMDSQYASAVADMKEFPILGAALGTEVSYKAVADRCREVGVAPRDGKQYEPVVTEIPSLIIEGDMDPITPPPLAKAIMPGFQNGTYVEFPFAGHGPSRSVPCAGDMLNLFFDNPNQKPDLTCVETMKAPEFISPLFKTSFAQEMALLAVTDKKALVGPIAWGGISSLILAVSFLVLVISPIFRKIDRRLPSETNGSRTFAVLTATAGFLTLVTLGIAVAKTVAQSEILIIFGMVSTAWWPAVLGMITGLLGIITLLKTVKRNRKHKMASATLTGFILVGLSGVLLSSFMIVMDLSVF